MQEKEQLLKDTIERTQNIIETNAENISNTYDKQVIIMLEGRTLFEQFKKQIKEYSDTIQFYIKENASFDLSSVLAKYKGIDIAIITISKENTIISTETYDKNNKEQFNCNTQLKNEDINSIQAKQFLEYFKQDLKLKNKPNKEIQESMLMAEFSKKSSYDKLLTGIQPIKYVDTLYFRIPITINPKQTEYINILARTKVRKITIVEVLEDSQDLDTILAQATSKAVFLTNLLHTEQGDKWYKLFGFHRKITNNTNN